MEFWKGNTVGDLFLDYQILKLNAMTDDRMQESLRSGDQTDRVFYPASRCHSFPKNPALPAGTTQTASTNRGQKHPSNKCAGVDEEVTMVRMSDGITLRSTRMSTLPAYLHVQLQLEEVLLCQR